MLDWIKCKQKQILMVKYINLKNRFDDLVKFICLISGYHTYLKTFWPIECQACFRENLKTSNCNMLNQEKFKPPNNQL